MTYEQIKEREKLVGKRYDTNRRKDELREIEKDLEKGFDYRKITVTSIGES